MKIKINNVLVETEELTFEEFLELCLNYLEEELEKIKLFN